MVLATGSRRAIDRLHSEIRKINAPTIQWSQLGRPSGVKPSAQGATKIQAPSTMLMYSCHASMRPIADSATRKTMIPKIHAFHAA